MKYFFLLIILFFAQCATVKKLTPKEKLLIQEAYESNKEMFAFIAQKLQLKPNDTICDIAGGYGHSSSLLANFVPPNTIFIEEDIIDACTAKTFTNTFKYYNSPANINNFRFVKGTEKTIPLKSKNFSTVTLFISIHEFSQKDLMLLEISRIMRKDATLCIVEVVSKEEPLKDLNCGFTLLNEQELYKTLNHARFKIITDTTFNKDSDTAKCLTKVFTCKKM